MMTDCRHYGRAGWVAAYYKRPMSLRIKTLRVAKGWTQQELADRAHMSRSQLAQIEAETRPANTLRLNAIAAALGVHVEELFDGHPVDLDVADIVEAFNRLTPSDRLVILRTARAMARLDQDAD